MEEKIKQLEDQLNRAQQYIVGLKLQIGDLYSGVKERDIVLENQRNEIEKLHAELVKHATPPVE